MIDDTDGLLSVRLHYDLDRARACLIEGRWEGVVLALEKALQLAHKLNGDDPEWRPSYGGDPRPLTRDPFGEYPLADGLAPPEDPYGDEQA